MIALNHDPDPQRKWRRSVRPTLLVGAAAAGLLLTACGSPERAENEVPVTHEASSPQIIGLPHGSFAAVAGSAEEALAKFMASNEAPPRTFRFDMDQFARWSDQLTPQAQGTLTTIILILTNYPNAKVLVAGYTDNEGSAEANLTLSQHRVDTLRQMLIRGGVAPSAISTIGRGMADPIGDNNTVAGRARNRRIELTVTAK